MATGALCIQAPECVVLNAALISYYRPMNEGRALSGTMPAGGG